MVAVMTVLALLALALTPLLIKQLDRMAWEKESSQLKSFADGFRQGVVKTKSIPNQTGWDQMIATNLGLEINQVRINERRQARVFLIDPAFQVGGNVGLNPSYVQDANGVTAQPVSPRLLIISSLSKPLPTGIVSGVASSTTAFNNIWDAAEGSVPAGWSWNGRGEDLKVQRIYLRDVFLRLNLNVDGSGGAMYSIEGATVDVLAGGHYPYFIEGTQLGLYNNTNHLEYGEILRSARTFYYVFGTWRSTNFLGRTVARPGPMDLERAAAKFMGARTNACAVGGNPSITTWTVRDAMIAYMSNYVGWCQAGFPGCTTDGNNNPSAPYGDILNANQNQFGSRAYLGAKTTGLICH
ncbi:MAG TPA: hypothetical protein VNU68_31345 [Verrucomicrobiae bacterium]|nr:hypothetical protein [Verrucomicrobiae bacterium]